MALGRAIVRRAKAFLMDEPLGALDAEFRDLMCEELRLLHNRIGATTVYVTHDQIEAMSMADRICIMDKGEVLQVGPPMEVYERPATKFVAGFIGSPSMNFLAARGNLAPGAREIRVNGATVAMPEAREGLAARRRCSARGRSTSASPRSGAVARRGVRRRIYGRAPAHHRRYRRRARCGCGRRTRSRSRTARRSASPSIAERLSCSIAETGQRAAQRAFDGGAHG